MVGEVLQPNELAGIIAFFVLAFVSFPVISRVAKGDEWALRVMWSLAIGLFGSMIVFLAYTVITEG